MAIWFIHILKFQQINAQFPEAPEQAQKTFASAQEQTHSYSSRARTAAHGRVGHEAPPGILLGTNLPAARGNC